MTTADSVPFAKMVFENYLEQIAAKIPAPGGGAVACSAGALSASLARMVVNYSIGKKNLTDHQAALVEAGAKLDRARAMYLELGEEDAAAYGLVNELQKLPETDSRRVAELPGALQAAADVPLAAMALSVDLLRMYEELVPKTNKFLHSDLGIAAVLAEGTNRSSAWNVHANSGGLPPTQAAAVREQFLKYLEIGNAISRRVELACRGG